MANFWRKSARRAPTSPSTIANVSASSAEGSCTNCGANSTPAAKPIAATQSQKSLRPNNKTITPTTALMIGSDIFISKLLQSNDARIVHSNQSDSYVADCYLRINASRFDL